MDYSETHLSRVKSLGFKTIKCNFDCNEDVERINKTLRKSFDVIATFEVIEHIFDVDTFLFTAHNLLKNNGYLIISTPNISYLSYRIYSKFRGNLPVSEGHHVRFFNPPRLQQTLSLNGFDVVYDYSFGKGDYYLDRAIGENKSSLRSLYIKALFRCWSFFIPKHSPSYYSSTLFLAKKADTVPVGLDPTFRNVVYSKLPVGEKKKVINRLCPLRIKFFFDEHPGLRKFIDEEKEKLSRM
jgi:predicted SAM-dependent methyltransferase